MYNIQVLTITVSDYVRCLYHFRCQMPNYSLSLTVGYQMTLVYMYGMTVTCWFQQISVVICMNLFYVTGKTAGCAKWYR